MRKIKTLSCCSIVTFAFALLFWMKLRFEKNYFRWNGIVAYLFANFCFDDCEKVAAQAEGEYYNHMNQSKIFAMGGLQCLFYLKF